MAETKKQSESFSIQFLNAYRVKKHNKLVKESIIQDNAIKLVTIDKFHSTNTEEKEIKNMR
ncbi:hypothetical protein M3603_08230 [Rummeliibacillus stabekisii]|uniref:hypothetical protein n=1 Tax=Rummeliibacillus stabekisii TaxID=241244 RepID=UPI00203F5499|nr:hypothetical protein [Rummeliibacillus stabekisii]MCM3316663.1 hypothetical protein [Rummeliibacillus stabekisii]